MSPVFTNDGHNMKFLLASRRSIVPSEMLSSVVSLIS